MERTKSAPDSATRLSELTSSIPKTNFLHPDGKPESKWKVFYGPTWEAAKETARKAAEKKAEEGYSKVGESTWQRSLDRSSTTIQREAHAAGLGKEWDMARETVRSLVTDGVSKAAGASSRLGALELSNDAARDARLLASSVVASGLKFDSKDAIEEHAKARWEVWQKGYALLCDVDGTLYVYAPESARPKGGMSRLLAWVQKTTV